MLIILDSKNNAMLSPLPSVLFHKHQPLDAVHIFFQDPEMELRVITTQQDLSGFNIDISQRIDANWAYCLS